LAKYGSITWDLPYVIRYVPGTKIEANVTIANIDVVAHGFSLVLVITVASNGVVYTVHEQYIPVVNQEWFTLEPGEVINTTVALMPATVPSFAHLCLKEFRHQEYTDGVTVKVSRGMGTDEIALLVTANMFASMMGIFS